MNVDTGEFRALRAEVAELREDVDTLTDAAGACHDAVQALAAQVADAAEAEAIIRRAYGRPQIRSQGRTGPPRRDWGNLRPVR